MTESKPEVWLRGPLAGHPALLQPVAHGLLPTVIGLLFHGAEHLQRHRGQCASTLRLVRATGAAGA